jgi:regulator of sigma E protease
MHFIIHIIVFLVTVLVLITVHEFGHFWVAKRLGVKVLRFSIGFGGPLFRWYGKDGTEYVIAWLPLGGYVKLLDGREAAVSEAEKSRAFDNQPLPSRFAIVLAGPVINALFAVLAFWLVFMIGFVQVKPVVGAVNPNSIAAAAGIQSGQEFISLNGHPTPSWQKLAMRLIGKLGDKGSMTVQAKFPTNPNVNTYTFSLQNWKVDSLNPDPITSLGIVPYQPLVPAVISKVILHSPGEQGGLRVGDKILTVDQQTVNDWFDFLKIIQSKPQQKLTITVLRDQKPLDLQIITGRKWENWKWLGYLGIEAKSPQWPENIKTQVKYPPISALWHSVSEVGSYLQFNFVILGKILIGKVSLRSLGGPVTIFQSAGSAFNQGLLAYLAFLGVISLMLAFVNILPIPGLDGGHLLLFGIEMILGRPLSIAAQVLILRLGLIFLIVIMFQALMNDLLRIL